MSYCSSALLDIYKTTNCAQANEKGAKGNATPTDTENKGEDDEKTQSVGEQLLETVTSGRLVHLLNNFQIKTQGMVKRFQPVMSVEERLEAERQAKLADASVNPLYQFRTRMRGDDSKDDEFDADDQLTDET